MADLLKCPFCGGEAKVRHYEDIKKDFVSVYQYYVECTNCKTQSGWKANVEDAESAWNTRKPMEAVVAELEKKSKEYTKKAEEHEVYEDYCTRYYSIANGIDIAISIVRGKE